MAKKKIIASVKKRNIDEEIKLSFNYCYRIMKKAGAKQVSSEAVEELRKVLENIALDISNRSIDFAYDEARLKVSHSDLKNAIQEFKHALAFQTTSALLS